MRLQNPTMLVIQIHGKKIMVVQKTQAPSDGVWKHQNQNLQVMIGY